MLEMLAMFKVRKEKSSRVAFAALAAGSMLALPQTGAAQNANPLLTQAIANPAAQNNSSVTHEGSQDWLVSCEIGAAKSDSNLQRRCTLSGRSPDRQDEHRSDYSLTAIVNDPGKPALFFVKTPLGLLLSKGVEVKVDGKTLGRLSIRSCHADGCVVPFSFKGTMRKNFVRGASVKFTTENLRGEKQNAEFSLMGINNAIKLAADFMKTS